MSAGVEGYFRMGYSIHQNVREPDLETDSIEESGAHLFMTGAPTCLNRELRRVEAVMGQARLGY